MLCTRLAAARMRWRPPKINCFSFLFFSCLLLFSVILSYFLSAFCGRGEMILVILGSDLVPDEQIRWFSTSVLRRLALCVCLLGFQYGFWPEFLRVSGSWWSDGLLVKFLIFVEWRFWCFVDLLNLFDVSVEGVFLSLLIN